MMAPKRTKSIGQMFVGLRLYPWQYIKKVMEINSDAKTEERDAFPAVPQQMTMDLVLFSEFRMLVISEAVVHISGWK